MLHGKAVFTAATGITAGFFTVVSPSFYSHTLHIAGYRSAVNGVLQAALQKRKKKISPVAVQLLSDFMVSLIFAWLLGSREDSFDSI